MKYPFAKNTLFVPVLLLLSIWTVFFLQQMGLGKFTCYGIVPRNEVGLRGILLSPLFHSGWRHIISNSVPLFVLSFFAVLFYKRLAYWVLLFGWIFSGTLVWLFGNILPGDTVGCHIGASSLVYLLASFVFFSGVFHKSRNLIAISLIVVFLYGSMIWGVIPEELLPKFYREDQNPISWEGHLSGAVVGFLFAFLSRNYGQEPKKYSWENTAELDRREKWIWETYKESLTTEERTLLEEKYGENPKETKSDDDRGKDDYWFSSDSR